MTTTAELGRLMSVESGPSNVTIAKIMRVCFPDARTVLDLTFGRGAFWKGNLNPQLSIVSMDINPDTEPDVCWDFTKTGQMFDDDSFDVLVFDPPYHTDMGRGKASVMGNQYGTYPTITDLRTAVWLGVGSSWDVARLGMIVKVQDYVHGQKLVRMTDWVQQVAYTPPYERVEQMRNHKIIDPKWGEQYSAYRNHATYLVFRHGSQYHRKRRPR